MLRLKLIYVDKWVRGLSVVKATPNWRICTANKGFCNAMINMSCCYGLWAEWLHSNYTIQLLHRWFIVMVKKEGCILLFFSFLLLELNTSFALLSFVCNYYQLSTISDWLVRRDSDLLIRQWSIWNNLFEEMWFENALAHVLSWW